MLFCLSGCAHSDFFLRKDQRELKAALRRDWEIQERKNKIPTWDCKPCSEKSEKFEPRSICSQEKTPKFEVYGWDGALALGSNVDAVTAVYCPPEKKYWIQQVIGDYVLNCCSAGPFNLDIQKTGS